jgi:hypothetical protein
VEFVYRRVRVQWTEDRLKVLSWQHLPNGWLNITFPAPGWNLRVVDVDINDCQRNPNRTSTCSDFPTSVINLYSSLRQPGTGYVSAANNRVYYVPRPGDRLVSKPKIWVPTFDGPLLVVQGERYPDYARPANKSEHTLAPKPHFVENMIFAGLTLQHASWGHDDACGYLADQAGFVYDCDMRYCCTSSSGTTSLATPLAIVGTSGLATQIITSVRRLVPRLGWASRPGTSRSVRQAILWAGTRRVPSVT